MVDMVLDYEKSRTFDCQTCDLSLQINRNCSDFYSKTTIKLNDQIYRQCPRSMVFNKREERYLVDLYFDCKESKIYPFAGSQHQQTAYCIELFDYIESIVNIKRIKQQKENEQQFNKSKQSKDSQKAKVM